MNKEQKIKELQREVEVLKLQLKSNATTNNKGSSSVTQNVNKTDIAAQNAYISLLDDSSYLKKELFKTLAISATSFTIIAALYITGFEKVIQLINKIHI